MHNPLLNTTLFLKPEWVCHQDRWKNNHFFALETILAKQFDYDYWQDVRSDENVVKKNLIIVVFNSLMLQGESIVTDFIDTWSKLNHIQDVSIKGIFGKSL